MSQFLDNDQSVVGNLNENYAREILELHTVGADAGYGDDDIIAVARVFTGWNFYQTNPDSDDARRYDFEFTCFNNEESMVALGNVELVCRKDIQSQLHHLDVNLLHRDLVSCSE